LFDLLSFHVFFDLRVQILKKSEPFWRRFAPVKLVSVGDIFWIEARLILVGKLVFVHFWWRIEYF